MKLSCYKPNNTSCLDSVFVTEFDGAIKMCTGTAEPLVTRYGGGGGDTRHLFLLSLYNSKNIAENVSPGPLCSAFPGLTRLLKCILGIEYLNRGNKLILDQVKQIVYNYTYTKSHKKLTGQL